MTPEPDVSNTTGLPPQSVETSSPVFVDRRRSGQQGPPGGVERRQFSNSYVELSPEARELAQAIDAYKIRHHRRFIDHEELLAIIKSLGYHK